MSPAAAAPSAAATAAPKSSTARISLGANLPAVSSAGQAVTVTGTITNIGSATLDNPVVHVSVSGDHLLDTRSAADGWISGTLDVPLTEVASGRAGALAPGSSTPFSVTIPGKKLSYDYGLASLPMTVTVTDGGPAASAIRGMARSALQLQNSAVTSPLRVSIVVPLTLPADPDLFGPTGSARAAAWERAVGPDSLVQRTLDALAGDPVVFAVDPALIDPPAPSDDNVPSAAASASSPSSSPSSNSSAGSPSGATGSPEQSSSPASTGASAGSTGAGSTDRASGRGGTPDPTSTASGAASGSGTPSSSASSPSSSSSSSSSSPSPSSSQTSTPPDTPQGRIDAAVDGLTDRLTGLGSEQSVWWLPSDDPDLTALHGLGKPGQSLVSRDFARALPDRVTALGGVRLVWPTGDLPGAAVSSYTTQLAAGSKARAVALLPQRAVRRPDAPTAIYRAAGTSGVLTYDESLSGVFSGASTSPGARTGRLLTQLLALYQQSPGTPRSIALVAPRSGGANPTQLAARIDALQTAGWVGLRTGAQSTAALRTAPVTTLLKTPAQGGSTPTVPAKAVTADELAALHDARADLSALQSVLVGGDDVIPERKRALDIIGSTRWRGGAAKLHVVADRDHAAVVAMLHKLSIRSSTINFFADSGDISLTVSNELNRPVHDVQVELQRRKYLVRVTDSPQQVDIGAGARAAVHFHIEAVGGGTVPLDAVLRAPDGTALTDTDAPAQLKINVHPTSGWIMWVLGVLAALILAIGLWRAVRRGPRTASEQPVATDAPTPEDAIVDAGETTAQQTTDRGEGSDTDD